MPRPSRRRICLLQASDLPSLVSDLAALPGLPTWISKTASALQHYISGGGMSGSGGASAGAPGGGLSFSSATGRFSAAATATNAPGAPHPALAQLRIRTKQRMALRAAGAGMASQSQTVTPVSIASLLQPQLADRGADGAVIGSPTGGSASASGMGRAS